MAPKRRSYGLWILLAVIVVGYFTWRPLYSRYILYEYAKAPVATLADQIGLTDQAKVIFYPTNPKSDDKAQFQSDCPSSASSPELGCFYHGNIYYLQIERPEFQPEIDVTLAHEMLHAAYDGLSLAQRNHVNSLVEAEYHKLNNPELNATMAVYAKTEPGEEANELHSILGTEYGALPPELESYYSQYFTDRAKIVADNQSYKAAVNATTAAIKAELAKLKQQRGALDAYQAQMKAWLAAGDIATYNANVNSFNQAVRNYNDAVSRYNQDVAEANATLSELDSTQLSTVNGVQTQ